MRSILNVNSLASQEIKHIEHLFIELLCRKYMLCIKENKGTKEEEEEVGRLDWGRRKRERSYD